MIANYVLLLIVAVLIMAATVLTGTFFTRVPGIPLAASAAICSLAASILAFQASSFIVGILAAVIVALSSVLTLAAVGGE